MTMCAAPLAQTASLALVMMKKSTVIIRILRMLKQTFGRHFKFYQSVGSFSAMSNVIDLQSQEEKQHTPPIYAGG